MDNATALFCNTLRLEATIDCSSEEWILLCALRRIDAGLLLDLVDWKACTVTDDERIVSVATHDTMIERRPSLDVCMMYCFVACSCCVVCVVTAAGPVVGYVARRSYHLFS